MITVTIRPRNRRRSAVLLIAILLLATAGSSALARPGGANTLHSSLAEGAGPDKSKAAKKRPEPNVTPAEAARRATREYGGRVLNVVLEDGPGGPYYRVKLLDGGRVRVVRVEARH